MASTGIILFDLDGTLTDPYPGISKCIAHALERMQVPVPARLEWCIGPPLLDSFAKLLAGHPGKGPETALALYRERFATTGLFENALYPGIPEMLSTLGEAGYRLYVATAKPWVYAEQIVAHFGLGGFFRRVYGAELDGARTVKGELIRYLLEQESISPPNGKPAPRGSTPPFPAVTGPQVMGPQVTGPQVTMVGDREHDLIGARENGLGAVAVRWGYGALPELEAQHPDAICADPGEVAAYFLGGERIDRLSKSAGL